MTPGSPDGERATPMASEDRGVPPVLVLAVGNTLLGDDGCGQRILDELRRVGARWSGRAELIDGGTQGLALLGALAGRQALVVLDAVRLGAPPGTVHRLRGDPLFASIAARGLTAHEGNAGELLRGAALLGDLPPEVAVVGIEPAALETRVGLSPRAQAAVPAAARTAAALVDDLLGRLAPA